MKSAAKVPVNGAEPVPNETAEAELIIVFVKLSPEPPRPLTRFTICPFGAFRLMVRSPSQVCVTFRFTSTPVTTAPAGNAGTVMALVNPAGKLSGILRLTAPEVTSVLAGTPGDPPVILIGVIVPWQTVAVAGATVIDGIGFTMTVAVIGVPEQPLTSGVIVNVTVTGAVVVLVNMPLILPLPLAAIPVTATVLSRVQL